MEEDRITVDLTDKVAEKLLEAELNEDDTKKVLIYQAKKRLETAQGAVEVERETLKTLRDSKE